MTEPLTPEEERSLRNAIARGEPLRLFAVSRGIRHVVTRLLATLDAARQPAPEAGLLTRDRAALAATPTPDPSAVAAPCGDCGPYAPCPKHDGDTVDPAAVAAWLSEDDRLAEAMVGVWEGGPDRDQPVDVWLYGWAAAIIHALREQGAVRSNLCRPLKTEDPQMTRALGASMAAAGVAMVIYALTLPDFLSWLVGLPLLLIGAHLWTEDPR